MIHLPQRFPARLLVLGISLMSFFNANGQTGPGGVGNSGGSGGQPDHRVWLRAHSGTSTTTDGVEVSTWNDQSGSANNFSSPASNRPTYEAGEMNGWPVLRFGGDDYADAGSALGIAATGGAHYFMVFDFNGAPTAGLATDGAGTYLLDRTSGTNGLYSFKVLTGNVLSYQKRTDAGSGLGVTSTSTTVTTGTSYLVDFLRERGTSYRISINGTQEGTTADAEGNTTPPQLRVGRHATATNGGINGDIAEVLVYGTSLNAAQQLIVQNYLAAKYALTVSNDIYSYQGVHYYDVAGIGRASVSASHISATSAGLNINVASLSSDGQYALFGHDNGTATTLTTIGGDNFYGDATNTRRIAREWRMDKSGGDLGTVSISFDSTTISTGRPSTAFTWALLIDTDGDGNFSTGSPSHADLTISGTNLTATGVSIPDGSYFTIGALRRSVSFSSSTASGFENATPFPVLTASLNYAYTGATDVTFSYTVTAGTAEGADFQTTRTSATITGGTSSEDLNDGATAGDEALQIIDDGSIEGTQTVVVTITTASITNAIAGSITALTYSILDDDEPRKIAFESVSVSQAEGNGADIDLTINFSLTSTDVMVTSTAVNSTVDITATGTATLGDVSVLSNDARLYNDGAAAPGEGRQTRNSETTSTVTFNTITGLSGVATIVGVITLTINSETVWDPDETVILTLSNPQNCALNASNTVITITITNDDSAPTVEFQSASSGFSEAAGTGTATIELSAVATSDVSVNFSVAAGTPAATDATDYSMVSTSPVTITAGNTTVDISFTIVNDASEESDEVFVITLTGTNATLGAQTTNNVYILDNDGVGSTGPGGVGDSDENRLWIRADAGTSTTTDGAEVSTWNDQSGNANNTSSPVANRGTYESNEANGFPVIRFGGNDYYDTGSSLSIAGTGGFHYFVVVKGSGAFTIGTTGDGNGWYLIDRTTATNALASLKLTAGGTFGYQKRTDAGAGLGGVSSTTALSTTSFQIVNLARIRGTAHSIYVNSVQEGTLADSDGDITPGTPRIGRHATNTTTGGLVGDMAELAAYNTSLNNARRLIVENYLSAKYGIPITNDFYTGNNAAYIYDVQGIGTTDGTSANIHRKAENGGGMLITELNGSLNAANEFLIAGHQLVLFSASSNDLPGGLDTRWDRVWYVDKTGSVDARIGFDMSQAGSGAIPAVAANYRLLYRAGTSGTFSSVVTAATSIENTDQVVFDVSNASIVDGYYTIGSTDESTSPLPIVLSQFRLRQDSSIVKMDWSTETEQNNYGFRIERRLYSAFNAGDGYDYVTFIPGAGNSLSPRQYAYNDTSIYKTGEYQYRLIQIDYNTQPHVYGPYLLKYEAPTKLALLNTYPNPFNAVTAIPFTLPSTMRVLMEVYDLNGRRIATLLNETREGGFYRISFNAQAYSSGVYLIRLQAGGRSIVRKITLLK